MTKCGKGVVLEDSELFDLLGLIEDALGCGDDDSDDLDDSDDFDDSEDEEYVD